MRSQVSDMNVYVVFPDDTVIEVVVGENANGQECLDKVCQKCGIVETDYYGLKYEVIKGARHEYIWLNMRNMIKWQCHHSHGDVIRLKLRFKFYIQPHSILQDVTRRLFYHTVVSDLRSGQLVAADDNQAIEMTACMAQAEIGDYQPNTTSYTQFSYMVRANVDDTAGFWQAVAERHVHLVGVAPSTAYYLFLKKASKLEYFGFDFFQCRSVQHGKVEKDTFLDIGVGPDSVTLHLQSNRDLLQRVPFTCIRKARLIGAPPREVSMDHVDDMGNDHEMHVRLRDTLLANELYRIVTEKRTFYQCDTVIGEINEQYHRDLKGTIASLFGEKFDNGKRYIFDIQHTFKQAHESAMRILYKQSGNPVVNNQVNRVAGSCQNNVHDCRPDVDYQEALDELEAVRLAVRCSVCLDDMCNVAFQPCGHIACCQSCANNLQQCPICRQSIQKCLVIYLPYTQLPSNECKKLTSASSSSSSSSIDEPSTSKCGLAADGGTIETCL